MATPNQVVDEDGRCLSGRELQEYARRHGLCEICGLFRTHRRVGNFWVYRMEPMTVVNPETGVTTVYKGHCIQPTCYTSVDQVKMKLGEITGRRSNANGSISNHHNYNNHNNHNNHNYNNHNGGRILPSASGEGRSPMRNASGQTQRRAFQPRNVFRDTNVSPPVAMRPFPMPNDDDTAQECTRRGRIDPRDINVRPLKDSRGDSGLGASNDDLAGGGSGSSSELMRNSEVSDSVRQPTILRDEYVQKMSSLGDGYFGDMDPNQELNNNSIHGSRHRASVIGTNTTGHGIYGNASGHSSVSRPSPQQSQQKRSSHSQQPQQARQRSNSRQVNASFGRQPRVGHTKRPPRELSAGSQASSLSALASDGNDLQDGSTTAPPPLTSNATMGTTATGNGFEHLTGASTLIRSLSRQMSRMPYANPVTEELCKLLIDDEDYIAFLTKFDSAGTTPDIVVEASKIFTQAVVKDQLARPNGVVLSSDGWVKTMKSKVDYFSKNSDVALQITTTFLTLSTLEGNHQKFMVKRGVIEAALAVLNRHSEDEEIELVVCALFERLSLNEKEGLNAKSAQVVNVMRKMASIISSGSVGRDYALRTLYRLTTHTRVSKSTNKPLLFDVRNILIGDDNGVSMVDAILKMIQTNEMNVKTVEAAMSLLCKLSRTDPTESEGNSESNPQWLTDDLIRSSLFCTTRFKSCILMESYCGMIANLALMDNFPNHLAQVACQTVCELLFQYPDSEQEEEALAVSTVHAICNLLIAEERRKEMVEDQLLISTVISVLSRYPGNQDIQELGCESISRACWKDTRTKKAFAAEGSVLLVDAAYSMHVTSAEKVSFKVKDAALCAMASLSGCREGASSIVGSGLIGDFEEALATESDPEFRQIIQMIVQNARKLASAASSRFGLGGSSVGGDPLQRAHRTEFQPKIPLEEQILRARSVSDIETIIINFRAWLVDTSSSLEERVSPFADGGFEALLEALRKHLDVASFQEEGSALLSELYYHLPCNKLNEPIALPSGSLVLLVHTSMAIETIRDAMRAHRRNAKAQKSCCNALANLLAPLCWKGSNASEEWVGSVNACLKDVVDAMAVNEESVEVQKGAITLFWTLSFVCDETELRRWTRMVLDKIFDSLQRFSLEDDDLVVVSCDLLLTLSSRDHESLESIGDGIAIMTILKAISPERESVVVSATAFLSSILKKVFTASCYVMQVQGSIRNLISCMASNRDNPKVQIHVCSILESVVTLEDNHVRDLINESGGLAAMCSALVLHGSDARLVEHACRALSVVITAADDGIMLTIRATLGDALIRVLEHHADSPFVQSSVMDVLCICCERDDYFKEILLNGVGYIDLIVWSMNEHLGSRELGKSGCSLLWAISSHQHGKEIIGQRDGIAVVVNSMLAHPEDTALQKEGLSALRNLATIPSNKELISQVGGRDAVMYALQIHFRDPQVISGAFAALNNISVTSETRTVAPLGDDVMRCLLVSLKRFPYDESVQKNACFLLKSCSYLDKNLRLMAAHKAQLLPLLVQAKKIFPERCGDRVDGILQKLSQLQG